MDIKLKPIGIVHSPFKRLEDIEPGKYAYPRGFNSIHGQLEIFEEYEAGLKDIEGFTHLVVIFVFHKAEGFKLHTKPLLDDTLRGVFSTRSPHRPNPIGVTVVNVRGRKGNILEVSGVDMIEGTPILDLKPYTPRDQKSSLRLGWLDDKMKKES